MPSTLPGADPAPTSGNEGREKFRDLPEPIRPDDAVESVDVDIRRPTEESEERERFLQRAGGA